MKQLQAAFAGALFLSFILLINLYIISFTQPKVLPFAQEVIRIETKREEIYQQFQLWAKLAQGSHGSGVYITSDPKSVSLAYFKDCWEDSNYLRLLMDPYCTLLWMMSLDHQSIISISNITPFSMTSDVGLDCKFDGVLGHFGVQGRWRSCNIHGHEQEQIRSFGNDIISFHADKLLGFYRILPKIPRLFSRSQLHLLSSDSEEHKAKEYVDSILQNCGRGDFVDGSLDGFLPTQFSLLPATQEYSLFYFKDLSEEEVEYHRLKTFNVGGKSKDKDKRAALEIISLNLFALIMDYYPPISTLHVVSNGHEKGPIIYSNSVEAKCETKELGTIYDHPLSKFCIFPKRTSERLLALRNFQTFGEVVSASTKFYKDFTSKSFLSTSCYLHLNMATQFLIEIIDYCIEENGYDNVIIEDLWDYNFNYIEKVAYLFANL